MQSGDYVGHILVFVIKVFNKFLKINSGLLILTLTRKYYRI